MDRIANLSSGYTYRYLYSSLGTGIKAIRFSRDASAARLLFYARSISRAFPRSTREISRRFARAVTYLLLALSSSERFLFLSRGGDIYWGRGDTRLAQRLGFIDASGKARVTWLRYKPACARFYIYRRRSEIPQVSMMYNSFLRSRGMLREKLRSCSPVRVALSHIRIYTVEDI